MPSKTPAKPDQPVESMAVKKSVSKRHTRPSAAPAGKVARKTAMKSPAPPSEPQPAKAGRQPKGGKAEKLAAKPRPPLVRDSFTMPAPDFALLATLKSTALGARRAAKKSELLRAGLRVLATLDGPALVAALDQLEAVKTGRPKKGH